MHAIWGRASLLALQAKNNAAALPPPVQLHVSLDFCLRGPDLRGPCKEDAVFKGAVINDDDHNAPPQAGENYRLPAGGH